MLTLRARFVVPVTNPVIENGAVVLDGDRIVEVGPARSHARGTIIDYGDAVIGPGFVNAHTHLELTHLADRVPPSDDFTDWLLRLVQEFSAAPPDRPITQKSVGEGIGQSLRAGVTSVGDITRWPAWTREVLSASPMGGVSFGEVVSVGTRRHLLQERLAAALALSSSSIFLSVGVSPHAPYTVEPDAMRQCADAARSVRAPLCIHLAETPQERDFTLRGEGVFVDYLRDLGVWDDEIPVGGADPVGLAYRAGLLTPRTVVAHANYVSDVDIGILASSGASVAYCPRTHDAFGHDPHRFRDMRAASVNVGIGTDSLASNPSLSVLDELRFLHRAHPDVPPELLIRMATFNGARALGLSKQVGSLSPGKRADVVVMRLAEGGDMQGWTTVLDARDEPCAVYAAGEAVSPYPQ